MLALEKAIVRIYSLAGGVVGAGFLAAPDTILTCHHVVGEATEVALDWPFLAPGRKRLARVVHRDPQRDVAVLRSEEAPPPDAEPVRLVTPQTTWGHPFRAFGFPTGHLSGVWASGVLRAPIGDAGWLQIEDVQGTGYFVRPGFSGGPVWDDEVHGVVGMVVSAERDPGVRAAFCIPAALLKEVWPEITLLSVPQPIEPPPASDARSVQISGNAEGNIIITGDGNVVNVAPSGPSEGGLPPVYASTSPTVVCPRCRLESPADARRCRNCGHEL